MVNRVLKHIPRGEDLKGGWLHRIVGERLFCSSLWRPTKNQVVGGLALGIFIGLTPTMGIQMILSGLAAFLLRLNIPASMAACWITNPVSAPFIYALQYKLGVYLTGIQYSPELLYRNTVLQSAMCFAKPLWIGSLASATILTPIAYLGALFGWEKIARALQQDRNVNLADPAAVCKVPGTGSSASMQSLGIGSDCCQLPVQKIPKDR